LICIGSLAVVEEGDGIVILGTGLALLLLLLLLLLDSLRGEVAEEKPEAGNLICRGGVVV
jgi:hypothetical protein